MENSFLLPVLPIGTCGITMFSVQFMRSVISEIIIKMLIFMYDFFASYMSFCITLLHIHIDTNWIKIDQLDVTCFIISLFTAGWSIMCFGLHKDTTPPQPNHTVTPIHIEPEQYNTWNKSTISRKLLNMDVLTFETCWAVNSEIIKQVTSSWSVFIQLLRWCKVQET